MAEQPFPLQKPNDMPLETYLLHLLAAIVKRSGGELKLTCHEIIAATGSALTRHPSEKSDAIVLRATPKGTDTYFVKDAPAWTAQPTPRTRVVQPQPSPIQTMQHDSVPKTSRSKQLDDMALYLMEQEQMKRAEERQRTQQASDLRETGVYPWHEDRER